ncbi:MAG TPA: HdeD family acid-resistance protein [Trebonia sp.]
MRTDETEHTTEDRTSFLAMARAWQVTLVIGLVTLALGIVVASNPSGSLNLIAVLLGITLLITGIFHLVRAFTGDEGHRVWPGIAGLLLVVIGVALIRHLNLTVALIGLLVGISWIAEGVSALAIGLSRDAAEGQGWWIFFGIISLIGGIVVAASPVTTVTVLAVLLGIWFIVQGAFMIIAALMLRHAVNKPQASTPVKGPAPVP